MLRIHGGDGPIGCDGDGFYSESKPYGSMDVLLWVVCRDGTWHIYINVEAGLSGIGSTTANLTVDEGGHLVGTAHAVVEFLSYDEEGEEYIAFTCNATITFGPP